MFYRVGNLGSWGRAVISACLLVAPVPGVGEQAMTLGVQTHFSQGWPRDTWQSHAALGNPPIRDAVPWSQMEQAPGQFRPSRRMTQFLFDLSKADTRAILTFAHSNPHYDAGHTPHTEEGIAALTRFVVQTLRDHGDRVRAVEIGNEINAGTMQGPGRETAAETHLRQLRALYPAIKALDPDMPVLGGAVHSVALGFLDQVFALGGLEVMDGIVVHPYRPYPEGLADELAALNAMMDGYGTRVPIYVTEFGSEFDDPADAAPILVKMVAILSDAGVAEAYWYALLEQAHFQNMGLVDAAGQERPGAMAFRLMQGLLAEHGAISTVVTGATYRHYETADGLAHVLWGAGHSVTFGPGSTVVDATGAMIDPPQHLALDPIVVFGPRPAVDGAIVFADSLLQYGQNPWSYAILGPDGRAEPAQRIDWNWTSYLGTKWTKPAAITPGQVVLSGAPDALVAVQETVTLTPDAVGLIEGDWAIVGQDSDGARLTITYQDSVLYDAAFKDAVRLDALDVAVGAGGDLVFTWHPGKTSKGDRIDRHLVIK